MLTLRVHYGELAAYNPSVHGFSGEMWRDELSDCIFPAQSAPETRGLQQTNIALSSNCLYIRQLRFNAGLLAFTRYFGVGRVLLGRTLGSSIK